MAIYEYRGARPSIGKDVYIADSAEVIGNVFIGDGVYVGPGAKIRGDYGTIKIGNGTAVEENCVIHARPNEVCTVGSMVTLGHMSIIHNAKLIDDYAIIGMGAIVSDWAVIGKWAVIAEGGLVKNKQEIPPEKIAAGIPVRVIADVEEKYKADWTGFKKIYVDLARTYKNDLKRIG
jgi:carbonic anhydrase/acetyltransferase-like protein (isoleucine patch superfamily)